ncbi:MAG: polyprenyl synthetase family protein [Bacteroidales bacterium]|nr:polyprenyl synthetase family protein [Bacteroidales bacterium]
MAKQLNEITACIDKELKEFEKMFSDCFEFENSSLKSMLSYVLSMKGKRVRPILTFLVAASIGKINTQTKKSAVIIELLHTASLLHDDVIDASSLRRGRKTLNALWDNRSAILIGDYLYGKALSLIETQEDFNLMPVYAMIAMDLPSGEIKEEDSTKEKDISLDKYLQVIYEKTASLIEASVLSAYISNDTKQVSREQMQELGHCIGMAFQIKDDILDYSENTGKEKGKDLKEKKITLPFIYYFRSLNEQEQEETLDFLFSEDKDEKEIERFIFLLSESGAVKQAEEKMEYYTQRAESIISLMPDNVYSRSLLDLVSYLTKREH